MNDFEQKKFIDEEKPEILKILEEKLSDTEQKKKEYKKQKYINTMTKKQKWTKVKK